GEEEPDAEGSERRGGGGAEHHRKEKGNRQPDPAIGDRRDEKPEHAHHFFGIRRQAEEQQAQTDRQQPQREQANRERHQPGEKFSEQQGVAVDRLRQHAAQGAAAELAVDRIEADRNRDQRDQKSQ